MQRWTTYELIFFDCDSTLSAIEGIDELARMKGKEQRVGLLTNKAMDGELDLAEVYGKRLRAINPTRTQLDAIKQRYMETIVEDGQAVIAALHHLEKHVYIISGGLLDAVQGFGESLGVKPDHIRAVELEYNQLSGEWWRYYDPATQYQQNYLDYNEGPLTESSGKPNIVRELAGKTWGQRMMIGDGASDLATRGNGVDLFVGYGGVVKRAKVEEGADIYLYCESLAPVLPLAAGRRGLELLQGTDYQSLFEKGLRLALDPAQVRFRDAELFATFQKEFSHA